MACDKDRLVSKDEPIGKGQHANVHCSEHANAIEDALSYTS
jgi:hypothetical protein